MPAAELQDHVIALNVGNIVTVITRPDAFTKAQWQGARARLLAQGFKDIDGTGCHFRHRDVDIDIGQGGRSLLRVVTAERQPFDRRQSVLLLHRAFRRSCRQAAIDALEQQRSDQHDFDAYRDDALRRAYHIIGPFVRLARRMPVAALTPPVVICAIGMGFMLIAISQMQRLMVFLGHPVYGLAVVLFTILLFSGIGSTTVDARYPRPAAVIARVAALLMTLVVAGLLTPLLTAWARSAATDMRILLSVLLLAPPAFCMGMMFPLGLSIWRRHSELLPFFWSANGITPL